MIQEANKFLVIGTQIIELKNIPGTLRWVTSDAYQTEFAMNEDSQTVDTVTRCGVGPIFSLSPDSNLTAACAVHDFAYNSPSYQAFHTRVEADVMLRYLMGMIRPHEHYLAEIFFKITRIFGSRFWENKETNI